ncbi:B-cadherin-like [Chanos chanos]|uniref:B-cadherin-like n=1 Tax=Chanos chanos TaxID=29144 RepID=A0A6J2UL66_CHACN|nr:B-cadherin-like [Chanos chanos]
MSIFYLIVALIQSKVAPAPLLLEFPKSSGVLKRKKRDWVIPPINFPENDRGPFPKEIVKIKSSNAKEIAITYSVTGPGVDQPPVGLFTINRNSGWLYVTQPLDRERQDKYTLVTHAVGAGGQIVEDPMDIIISVIDLNDNKPVFTQIPFLGNIHEAAKPGTEFMKVTATDADQPGTDNSDLRYSIVSQEPKLPHDNMFAINPVTGAIRLSLSGLDREKYPKYTLEIQVADMRGDGAAVLGKAVITVTESNDNAPQFDRDWVIPPINFPENDRGPFPKEMVQIKSCNAKEIAITYSATGPGADQPPVGLFTVDRNSGWLYVTQPLDRERQDKYTLQAHAVGAGGQVVEDPMDIIINVIDVNDNKPVFTQNPFLGSIDEAAKPGTEFMKVEATDADQPGTDNSDLRYSIVSQEPKLPNDNMFAINPVTGGIRLGLSGLDREKYPKYTLEIQVADMRGDGAAVLGKAVITVKDSNDNAPQFEQTSYTVSVPENEVGYVVVKMPVTDGDEPNTPAFWTKYKIISGDTNGAFNVTTGPNKMEGIITTAKPLDFEKNIKYTLLVIVENDVPFATPLATSTATVTVDVTDVNEAPVFKPPEKTISMREDLPFTSDLALYTATDPDTTETEKLLYEIGNDPAGWLNVNKKTGQITLKSSIDRESAFVQNGKYRALIFASDNGDPPATGTGTLIIEVESVNENAPTIKTRTITVCNRDPQPVEFPVTNMENSGHSAPLRVKLMGMSESYWTARMNDAALDPGTTGTVVLGPNISGAASTPGSVLGHSGFCLGPPVSQRSTFFKQWLRRRHGGCAAQRAMEDALSCSLGRFPGPGQLPS